MSNHNYREEPLTNYRPGQAAPSIARPVRRVQTGMIPAAHMSIALIWQIRILAIVLIMLSLFGTFYGMHGAVMPLSRPGQLLIDIGLAPAGLALAFALQLFFSVVQWGSMGLAKSNPRWWAMYLMALGFSAYWNWQAYGEPLIAMRVPWLLALIIIIASDVLAEKALVV